MRIGGVDFIWGERTYIMGIINVSPDSFSGDGLASADRAVEQARSFAAAGADILDIGGESTRPGSRPVTVDEEIRRVVPVIERISAQVPVPLSVDTYKPEVAWQALEAGAHMLNDIWGLKKNCELAVIAAERGVPVILMANQREEPADDIVPAVIADLNWAVESALAAGIAGENIILDPGIGFGKTSEQNLELIRCLGKLKVLEKPLLLATSRKSVIGQTLGLAENDRVEGTAATVALGIAAGADIIRVHDVMAMSRVARMSDAIVRGRMSDRLITVYLGLGSNMGDRRQNLERALGYIAQRMRLIKQSPVYETEPVGNTEQPKFLNQVCEVKTMLSPETLLAFTKDVEQKMGRPPSHAQDSPRTMDIDILFYADQVLSSPDLTVPHPRLSKRAFVLVPLNEIAPELVDPASGRTIAELLEEVRNDARGVRQIGGCR